MITRRLFNAAMAVLPFGSLPKPEEKAKPLKSTGPYELEPTEFNSTETLVVGPKRVIFWGASLPFIRSGCESSEDVKLLKQDTPFMLRYETPKDPSWDGHGHPCGIAVDGFYGTYEETVAEFATRLRIAWDAADKHEKEMAGIVAQAMKRRPDKPPEE